LRRRNQNHEHFWERWKWHDNERNCMTWHDNSMTMTWQWHDNSMTMTWQWHDNDMTMAWQWNDNGMTMAWHKRNFVKERIFVDSIVSFCRLCACEGNSFILFLATCKLHKNSLWSVKKERKKKDGFETKKFLKSTKDRFWDKNEFFFQLSFKKKSTTSIV